MYRSILATALLLAVTAAHAAPNETAIRATVAQVNAAAKVSSIRPTPIPGLNEVVADGTVVYISDDGRYLVHGVFLDVETKQNLTEIAGSSSRRELLASVPQAEKISFVPKGKPLYTVTVFTDISCHYCQELHKNLQGYLDAGIQIDYVAFPRGGPQSPVYGQMISVWCAKDRKAAFSTAIAGGSIPATACENPVQSHYNLGERLQIEGTPAIYSPSGMQLGGFLPPDQMLTALKAENARAAATASKDQASAPAKVASNPN